MTEQEITSDKKVGPSKSRDDFTDSLHELRNTIVSATGIPEEYLRFPLTAEQMSEALAKRSETT